MVLPHIAAAKLYRIPSQRDSSTIQSVLTQDIPKELQTATCGYPKDMNASDSYTDVEGLPLKPNAWPTAGGVSSEEDKSKQYPDNAYGFTLAIQKDFAQCSEPRNNNRPCNTLDNCKQTCDGFNTNPDMQYKVYRVSACTRTVSVQVGTDTDGNPIMQDQSQTYDTSQPYPDDPSFTPDCNTCPAGWSESDYAFVGTKYLCTSDPHEQAQSLQDGSRLSSNYGWVWETGVGAAVDLPTGECKQKWTAGDQKEWPNCAVCNGEECRTDPNHTPPPAFTPLNNAHYESFYREYVASHTLTNIPDTTTEDQNLKVTTACFSWYKEDLHLTDPGDFSCAIYEPKPMFEELHKRRVSGTVELQPANEETTSSEAQGAFSFDLKKAGSTIATPAVPPPDTTQPFGETPKYVTVLEQLENKMSGVPPTVEIILPHLDVLGSLAASGAQVNASATGTEMHVDFPMEPGLLDKVQSALKQAIFSRIEEEPIPVVLPLLSPSELLASIKEWEDWKGIMKAQKGNTAGADEVIAKLKAYQSSLDKYATLRASLPSYIAATLDRREQLTKAIDTWIQSRMQPYQDALASRQKMQDLVNAWSKLKDASAALAAQNQHYCKADSTTPPLTWLESAFSPPGVGPSLSGNFTLPTMPDIPKHLVFDFSDIFIEGTAQEASVKIPVLMPVLVSLKLPHPPANKDGSSMLPDLPDVPALPDPPQDKINVQSAYGAAPSNPAISEAQLSKFISDLQARTTEILSLTARYFIYLWNQSRDPTIVLNTLPQYPETRLWDVFMRLWSPVGAFLKQDVTPPGAMSSSSSSSVCAKDDDACRLREQLLQDHLRVTLPKDSQSSKIDTLRDQMMEKTIEKDGSLKKWSDKTPPYDIRAPQDLYNTFITPPSVPLEHSSASSSSSSSSS